MKLLGCRDLLGLSSAKKKSYDVDLSVYTRISNWSLALEIPYIKYFWRQEHEYD